METVTVYRGNTDKYGNTNKIKVNAIDVIFGYGPGTSSNRFRSIADADIRCESAHVIAELYVKKDVDLKHRDRIERANGEQYSVVGHSLWDDEHPFDGFNFGWKMFQVESLNG